MVTRIETAQSVAEALVKIEAVGVDTIELRKFKSGLLSPIYIDNRTIPYFPEQFDTIIRAFSQLINELQLEFDVVAGVADGGIAHSSNLGRDLRKPSVFVRKEEKEHGRKKMVEGGPVTDKRVLLIEDHVTTLGSSVRAIEELRKQDGLVDACLAITTYGFPEATAASIAAGVTLNTLTEFSYILDEMRKQNVISAKQRKVVDEWFDDPYEWTRKRKEQESKQ